MTLILGIETSCDETAAALVADGREIRSNVVSSQIALHAQYGGVYPEMASREHVLKIVPVVERALREDRRDAWPLITLNLDFKDNEAPHLQAVWELLGEYEPWLSTAERTASSIEIAPIRVGPVLVLTGEQAEHEREFYDRVPGGGRLRVPLAGTWRILTRSEARPQ